MVPLAPVTVREEVSDQAGADDEVTTQEPAAEVNSLIVVFTLNAIFAFSVSLKSGVAPAESLLIHEATR